MSEKRGEMVEAVLVKTLDDLKSLVRIESVGADAGRRERVQRSAEEVSKLLHEAGFAEVEIVSAGGAPAVIARHPAPPGAPTVLLYAHHDVQPEGDHDLWVSPPFEPTERDGRLYGRGAADDKAGIAAHLAAFRAHGGNPPVGVTVFVEGEEESGSPSLVPTLEQNREKLAADVIVIADSANWDVGVPALTTSLRGLVAVEVEVQTLDHAVHSGLWGGVAPDALTALVRLLASLHDDDGNVVVAGLHTSEASDVEYPPERLRSESGMLDGVEDIGSGSIVERLWAKPAISIIGLDAPKARGASNTLVPSARATISMRIAPGSDAEQSLEALKQHLQDFVPWGARISFDHEELGGAFRLDAQGPAYDAARSAFRQAWDGVEPIDMGMGGSIPFIAEFAKTFPEAAILVTGVEDPDTRAHGANESLHLAEFARVCQAETLLLSELAERLADKMY